jgi:ubiquinone biosynthesis protein COQ4
MLSFLNRFRIIRIFIQLVINPNRTDLIFNMVKILTHDPRRRSIVKTMEEKMLSDSSFTSMYESGYLAKATTMADLEHLPDGSFGRALYRHLHDNHLDLDFFPQIQPKRLIDYFSLRMYQDHDLWHVLLGYGVTVEDELAVQAFSIAQFGSPVGSMIITGGMLHLLLKSPLRAVAAIGKISEGYQAGKSARFLPGIRLYDLFAKPLQEVRGICGLAAA